MANDAEQLLQDALARIQRNARLRKGLALLLVFALLAVAGHFVYEILPRSYTLKITGGDLLSNRHYLARSLQGEAAANGVALQVIPVQGSQEALEQVNQGRLDLALIQGGLETTYPNVTHVATIAPELLHFLVQPGINDITELRGKRVNLGSKKGGTRVIAKQILEFSGLDDGVDYVESNISAEQLVSLPVKKMPEAIVITSFAPSDVADYLVKQRGYRLLEIPFPQSLALRLGWVANSEITAYMYNVKPAVPERNIKTVGVNLHLVAHKDVDPRAIFKVLESLMSPALEVRLRMKMDEARLTVPSGFPLAEGTKKYLERKKPLLSTDTLDRLKALFGLVLSVASTLLVVFRWFKGPAPESAKPAKDDAFFLGLINEVAGIEAQFEQLRSAGAPPLEAIEPLRQTLGRIKGDTLAKLGTASLDNPQLPQQLLHIIADLRNRLESPPHA
ncbi:MAG TPA: TAXI family TRAP transporter solute-binding subunit [Rhodocyclaceae bacterium]